MRDGEVVECLIASMFYIFFYWEKLEARFHPPFETALLKESINLVHFLSFLGAFAKLRQTVIGFIVSVRLSVRMEKLGYHWMDFHEN